MRKNVDKFLAKPDNGTVESTCYCTCSCSTASVSEEEDPVPENLLSGASVVTSSGLSVTPHGKDLPTQ